MRKRLLPTLNVAGMVLMLFAGTMLFPLACSLLLDDGASGVFVVAALVTFVAGLSVWATTFRFRQELVARDGFLLVVVIWAGLTAFAAIPLLLAIDGLSFTDAYFEAMSGLTTAGATVISGLDLLPPSINIWRTELHWLGGMGIIVLAVAILPLLGVGGMQIYKAETPGPMKDTKLTPRITETAKGLWGVYAGLTLACILALKVAGMSWVDALIHAFSTMGTGGFSSHDASIGYFRSPAIEIVLMIFMLLAGLNFAAHFLALRQRSLAVYLKDPEARAFIGILAASVLLIAVLLWRQGIYPDFLVSLRYAAFNTISVATTTGFATTDYNLWPYFAPLWMLLLGMFVTSSGSTGGGIKMVRALILWRQGLREMTRLLHPQAQLPVKIGHQVIRNRVVFAVLAFLFLYLISTLALGLLLVVSGLDIVTSFSAIVASMNTIGPGLNQVGPATTYAALTDFQTWVCSFAMLLGRLELFTVLVLFTAAYWRR